MFLTMPPRPRFRGLGSGLNRASAIYEWGVYSCNFAGIVLGYFVNIYFLKISEAVFNYFRRLYAVNTFI